MLIIFTDLDGTLLDKEYSYKKAEPAINILRKNKIPIIPCTSKTRLEIKKYRKILNLNAPFISENGGAIFIPKGYFDFKFDYSIKRDGFLIIELGTSYKKIVKRLKEIEKKTGSKIIGFNDMSIKKIAEENGLLISEAKLAKKREYVEPFKIISGKRENIIKEIKKYRLKYTRSASYNYIMGDNDKGKAVKILTRLFKKQYKKEKITTIGIGDNLNDLPMLKEVDQAFLVKSFDNKHEREASKIKKIIKVKGQGPIGWNIAIHSILDQIMK